MYADLFRFSPHESEDSAVASDEEEEEDDEETEEEEVGPDDVQGRQEYTEMKEQMYQDKLQHLKRQLEQLTDGTLPEYSKKLRRLEGDLSRTNEDLCCH